jgi:hypothetical protein
MAHLQVTTEGGGYTEKQKNTHRMKISSKLKDLLKLLCLFSHVRSVQLHLKLATSTQVT